VVDQNVRVARLPAAAILVALVACDKGATTRLYTDDEVAAIKAKAAQRAMADPSSVTDVNTLLLNDLTKALDGIRQEPTSSVAVYKAIEQLQWVRRLGQDKPSLSRQWVVEFGEGLVANCLDAVLRRGNVETTELDALAVAIDHALATQPRIGVSFDGNMRWLRGSLLGGSFIPSSGVHHVPQDELALTLVMIDDVDRSLSTACPPDASLSECHRKLPARSEKLELAGAFLDRAADRIRAADDDERHRLQSELVREAATNQLGGYGFYVQRAAIHVSRLVALRVYIEVLRSRTCDVPPALLAPVVLGEQVQLRKLDRAMSIEPPEWTAAVEHPLPSWTVSCP
jgi:hypothetical protein